MHRFSTCDFLSSLVSSSSPPTRSRSWTMRASLQKSTAKFRCGQLNKPTSDDRMGCIASHSFVSFVEWLTGGRTYDLDRGEDEKFWSQKKVCWNTKKGNIHQSTDSLISNNKQLVHSLCCLLVGWLVRVHTHIHRQSLTCPEAVHQRYSEMARLQGRLKRTENEISSLKMALKL